MSFLISKADNGQVELLLQMMREVSQWLIDIGQPMWNPEYLNRHAFMERYNHPDCFFSHSGQSACRGICFDGSGSPFLERESGRFRLLYS